MLRYILFASLLLSVYASVPSSFDTRKEWPGCGNFILDQHHCGGCWAFCSAESFSDRLCVTKEAKAGTIMSPEPIIECSGEDCGGGSPHHAWDYLIDKGDGTCTHQCTEGCVPFDSSSGKSPKCHEGYCDDGSKYPEKHYAQYFHYMNTTNGDYKISDVQRHLTEYGPMGASFDVYSNFDSFFNDHPTGIYSKVSGHTNGRHCVKLIGYGTENKTDYWLFANSWGTDWADKGYFKVKRGINLSGFEEKFSEGYTKKQHSIMVEQNIPLPVSSRDDNKYDGGWLNQAEPMSKSSLVNDARGALKFRFGEDFDDEFTILAAKTQVVAGIQFDFKISIREEIHELRVWRDAHMQWHLM